MKMKLRSNKPVDLSNFLWALTRKISESRHAPFNFNCQQGATEVLQLDPYGSIQQKLIIFALQNGSTWLKRTTLEYSSFSQEAPCS